jgi:hypothetical protein
MAKVSYSQYSMYSSCPRQYKLAYIDKLGESSSNIHTLFGTACHETIQHFLSVFYGVSKKHAMEVNTDKLLLEIMKREFLKENAKITNGVVATKDELEEFYGDGRRIIEWLKKNIEKFYTKNGFELVGIEIPLNAKVKEGVYFIGFIDIVLRDLSSNDIIIIDLKTSTRGWNKYQKSDQQKNSQIVLYKKYYSELFNIPIDKVKVEYHIMRRKLSDYSPYPVPYVSKHIPPSGKPTVNKVYKSFIEFVDEVFDDEGNFKQISFPKNPGKNNNNCKWCEFYKKHCDGKI